MLTTRQLDIIMMSLAVAACISFIATVLFRQTDYWLVTSAVTLTLTGVVAMLNYFAEEDPE